MYRATLMLIASLLLTACTDMNPLASDLDLEATVSDDTHSSEILKNLPLPTTRIPVAVYDFPDQTGQFKENDNLAVYSSAVTKGGLSVLTKALNDAGNRKWFL